MIEEPTPSKPAEKLSDFDYEIYHSYEEIQNWMELIEQEYSEYVEIEELGVTHEGRKMRALKITSGKNLTFFIVLLKVFSEMLLSKAFFLNSWSF